MVQVVDIAKNIATNVKGELKMRQRASEMAKAALPLPLTVPDAPLRNQFDTAKQKLAEGIDSLGRNLIGELNQAVENGSFQKGVIKATDYEVDYKFAKAAKAGETPVTVLIETSKSKDKVVVEKMVVQRGSDGGAEQSITVINLGYGDQREPRLDKYAKTRRKEYPPKGKEKVVDIYTSETGLGTSSVSTNLTRELPVKGTHRVISFEATKTYGEGYGERRPSNQIGADEVVVSIGNAMENLSYPGGKKMKKLTPAELKEHETVGVRYKRANPYNSIFRSTRTDTSGKQIDVEYLSDMRLSGAIYGAGYTSSGEPMEIKTSAESYKFGRDDFSIFGDLRIPVSEQDTSRIPVPTVAGLIGK